MTALQGMKCVKTDHRVLDLHVLLNHLQIVPAHQHVKTLECHGGAQYDVNVSSAARERPGREMHTWSAPDLKRLFLEV